MGQTDICHVPVSDLRVGRAAEGFQRQNPNPEGKRHGAGRAAERKCSWWGVNLIVEKCGCWSPFSGRFVLLSKPFAPQSTPATPVASMCLRGAIGTHITAPEVIPTRAPALNTTQTPSQPYRLCGSVVLIMNLFFFPSVLIRGLLW